MEVVWGVWWSSAGSVWEVEPTKERTRAIDMTTGAAIKREKEKTLLAESSDV